MNPKEKQILEILHSEQLKHLQGRIVYSPKTSSMVWMKCGGSATALFRPTNKEELVSFLKLFPFKNDIAVIGAGSNLIVRDGGFVGVLISLSGEMSKIRKVSAGNKPIEMAENTNISETKPHFAQTEVQEAAQNESIYIHCGCGALDIQVANYCTKEGLGGLEFLSTIPGTIGGNIKMNASCYGSQISDTIIEVEYTDLNGNEFTVPASNINFQYRHNPLHNVIFTGATLRCYKSTKENVQKKIKELQARREATQPQKCRTSGSSFINPSNAKAWELISDAGMRGRTFGDAMVSEKHANFIINKGKATSTDVETLGQTIQAEVKKQFGINLKWEIEFLGQNPTKLPDAKTN